MSRICCVALSCVAMGLSAVCDCGISWSYSLFLVSILVLSLARWGIQSLFLCLNRLLLLAFCLLVPLVGCGLRLLHILVILTCFKTKVQVLNYGQVIRCSNTCGWLPITINGVSWNYLMWGDQQQTSYLRDILIPVYLYFLSSPTFLTMNFMVQICQWCSSDHVFNDQC